MKEDIKNIKRLQNEMEAILDKCINTDYESYCILKDNLSLLSRQIIKLLDKTIK